MRALALAAAITGALAAGAGCLPSLVAESSPPPGRSARLDVDTGFWGTKHYRLELSQGVAVAIRCEYGGPCEKLAASSENPAVAEVRLATLSALQPSGIDGRQPPSAIVIVGKAPGLTTVHVRSNDGGRDVPVMVLPPPGLATAARR
jgi:hypothetical protein